MSDHAAPSSRRRRRHVDAAERFEDMAARAAERDDYHRRDLFRRAAHLERELASVERDWAAIDEQTRPLRLDRTAVTTASRSARA